MVAAVRRAIAQPAKSLEQLAQGSEGSLRLRQGQSLGGVWVVDQVAQELGIKRALGLTHQAALGYWQVLARGLRPASGCWAWCGWRALATESA